jgi:hypothetical protein
MVEKEKKKKKEKEKNVNREFGPGLFIEKKLLYQ